MLAAASRLALPGLFLSFIVAAPAAAQSRPAGPEAPAACYRTIADRSSDTAASPSANGRCSEPREGILHGGWLSHAIMMVGGPDSGPADAPRPATAWRDAQPRFAVPPVYR